MERGGVPLDVGCRELMDRIDVGRQVLRRHVVDREERTVRMAVKAPERGLFLSRRRRHLSGERQEGIAACDSEAATLTPDSRVVLGETVVAGENPQRGARRAGGRSFDVVGWAHVGGEKVFRPRSVDALLQNRDFLECPLERRCGIARLDDLGEELVVACLTPRAADQLLERGPLARVVLFDGVMSGLLPLGQSGLEIRGKPVARPPVPVGSTQEVLRGDRDGMVGRNLQTIQGNSLHCGEVE